MTIQLQYRYLELIARCLSEYGPISFLIDYHFQTIHTTPKVIADFITPQKELYKYKLISILGWT
jgi:hypothetical protein